MKKIVEGQTRRVGSIFTDVDNNFISVCNSLIRIAFPDYTLKGYAETEPAAPTLFDCYLVREDATLWGIEAGKDELLAWSGIEWELLPFKITELNNAFQFLYFDADKIALAPITGLAANDVQDALSQITAALILHGITFPTGSGASGSI